MEKYSGIDRQNLSTYPMSAEDVIRENAKINKNQQAIVKALQEKPFVGETSYLLRKELGFRGWKRTWIRDIIGLKDKGFLWVTPDPTTDEELTSSEIVGADDEYLVLDDKGKYFKPPISREPVTGLGTNKTPPVEGAKAFEMVLPREDFAIESLKDAIRRYSGGSQYKYDLDGERDYWVFRVFDKQTATFIRNMMRDVFDADSEVFRMEYKDGSWREIETRYRS